MWASRVLQSLSPRETEELGVRLGRHCRAGIVFDLRGPLGAGKTCFVRGLARGLEIEGGVRSPTFTICQEHRGRHRLFHLDAYRVEEPAELLVQGWDEMREEGVVAVEWGDRIEEILPAERITLTLNHQGEQGRRLEFRARGRLHEALLTTLPAEEREIEEA